VTALLALATPPAFAAPSGDVTAIVRVDCRVLAVDPAPHRLVGYVFTPTGIVRVTHDYGERTSGTFETTRELAPLPAGAFDHLVVRIATPRFAAPHAYRELGSDPRVSDRRIAVRRAGTTAQFAVEEPVGAADQQFSYDAEIALGNTLDGLRGVTWTPITGGFEPFALCRTPRTALGRIVSDATPPVTNITVADCHHGLEIPPVSDLRAFVLTPDGRVIRATGETEIGAGRSGMVYESAVIGTGAYLRIAHVIESSPFFSQSHAHLATVVSDTRGTRVSASRGPARITWSSADVPVDRRRMIDSVILAVFAATRGTELRWTGVEAAPDPFAICRDSIQRGLEFAASF
jgi:hypothetical protein